MTHNGGIVQGWNERDTEYTIYHAISDAFLYKIKRRNSDKWERCDMKDDPEDLNIKQKDRH